MISSNACRCAWVSSGALPGALPLTSPSGPSALHARPPPRRRLGFEGPPPAPPRLHPAPADLRRLGPSPAIVDRRQRQQAPRLIGILRPLRQLAQSRGVVIPSNPNRTSHGKPPPVCHGESPPPR